MVEIERGEDNPTNPMAHAVALSRRRAFPSGTCHDAMTSPCCGRMGSLPAVAMFLNGLTPQCSGRAPLTATVSSPLIYGLASNLADHCIRSVPGGPHAASERENASID